LTPDFINQKLVGYIPPGSSLAGLPANLEKSQYLKEKKLPGFLSGRILLPFWQGNQIVYLTGRTLDKGEAKVYRILKRADEIAREKAFKQLKTLFGVTIGVIRKDYFNSQKKNRDDFLTYDGIKFKVPEGFLITKHGIFTGTGEHISFEPVFISRCGIYLEHLKNVPLCIDELTSKNMRNFQGLIYAISGGVSRGKASRNDPLDIV